MTDSRPLDMLSNLPVPHDLEAVKVGLDRWKLAIGANGESSKNTSQLADRGEAALKEPGPRNLLEAVFGNSAYLSESIIRDPGFFCDLIYETPRKVVNTLIDDLLRQRGSFSSDRDLMRALRIAKRRVSLTIAIADICNIWDLDQITWQLSRFADLSLSMTLAHLLIVSSKQEGLKLRNETQPEKDSGLVIIGMGKLGAFELNYSSDIDLIILYDTEKFSVNFSDKLQNQVIRISQNLIKIISERTADGYVFRTDFRLRPDPSSTPIALSLVAAETYYESLGQNWERAAMIKARPVAGDLECGAEFLENLTPFIWRKSLDFAAIQDIHSIMRQIQGKNPGGSFGVEGYNIKLGGGGIREIEFFAQTLQLIWGGREPKLRSTRTVEALQDLVAFRYCSKETADDLINSYGFFRLVEHRLQMINDEQTHTLPFEPKDFSRLATFLGYGSSEQFKEDVKHYLELTHKHSSQLFANSRSLTVEGKGNFSFTGGDSDPATLKTIGVMGFQEPIRVDAMVRGWHHGRYRALRSNRAREILTELLPHLMDVISKTTDPDRALLGFDKFLQGLPTGVQLFSMFQTNPQLMNLLIEIISMAPRLADHLSIRPVVLDSVLAPTFFENLPQLPELKNELRKALGRLKFTEDILNHTRRWARDRQFQVGVQQLRMLITSGEATGAYSDIAEAVVDCISVPITEEFINQHGNVEGGEAAVLALGRFGSREMNAHSDLDLVFIYRAGDGVVSSVGGKPLSVNHYFARLFQRQITALTALTPDGGLFEVDMQLRPSGNSGPIASNFRAFSNYHNEEAWTWEHMALTRARVVSATCSAIRLDLEAEVHRILSKPRDHNKLLRDVADMRIRIVSEKPANNNWSLKYLRGGLLDIEFIAQYLALRYAEVTPEILANNTYDLIKNLTRYGYLKASTSTCLGEALILFQALQGILTITNEGEITSLKVEHFSDSLKDYLAWVGGCRSFESLEAKVKSLASDVYKIFKEEIDLPADQLD